MHIKNSVFLITGGASGLGEAEVAVHLLLRVASLLVPDNHHRLAVEARRTAYYRVIIAIITVAMQFNELGEHEIDIVLGKGAVDVPCHLRGLPPGEVRKNIGTHLLDTALESGHIGGDVQTPTRQGIQFLDFLFQLYDRFFKFKVKRSSHDDTSLIFVAMNGNQKTKAEF
jgi:hypothetical protein